MEEPKSILEKVITDTIMRKLPEIQDKSKSPQNCYKVKGEAHFLLYNY